MLHYRQLPMQTFNIKAGKEESTFGPKHDSTQPVGPANAGRAHPFQSSAIGPAWLASALDSRAGRFMSHGLFKRAGLQSDHPFGKRAVQCTGAGITVEIKRRQRDERHSVCEALVSGAVHALDAVARRAQGVRSRFGFGDPPERFNRGSAYVPESNQSPEPTRTRSTLLKHEDR